MRTLARWHIWLGWLIGVPLLMWTLTGLVMTWKPIEEVRGNHLRMPVEAQALPLDATYSVNLPAETQGEVSSITIRMEGGEPVTTLSYADGRTVRYGEDGSELPTLNEVAAKAVVARQIKGGDGQTTARLYAADAVPFDFRRPMPVWQVTLEDGTRVYVGEQTGRIEAVRTGWWRLFDFMWGLHIMDLSEREDTSHPILIIFAALGVIGSLMGSILLFRRRKARVKA